MDRSGPRGQVRATAIGTLSLIPVGRISTLCTLNPPEAIPLSDRPGNFFSIRFSTQSTSGLYHSLTDRVFFIFLKVVFDQDVRGHTTVCQTGVFLEDILD